MGRLKDKSDSPEAYFTESGRKLHKGDGDTGGNPQGNAQVSVGQGRAMLYRSSRATVNVIRINRISSWAAVSHLLDLNAFPSKPRHSECIPHLW